MLTGPERPPHSGDTADSLVILLHGLGSDGNDLIGIAGEVASELPDTHFLSPNAPAPYAAAGFGFQWFDLYDRSEASMLAGIATAADALNQYIDAQLARFELPASKLAVVGFSQGTMTALHTMLRRPEPCAGILGYSGMLLGSRTIGAEAKSRPPVCLIHGSTDMVVPFAAMADAEAALLDAGIEVESHVRPGLGHGIDAQGIRYGVDFLKRRLGTL